MHRFFSALGASVALALAGCQTARPLYYWGAYEPTIYQSYVAPDKATPEEQARRLEADIQKAAAGNLKAHPGLHAHLGFVYYKMGRHDDARKQFEIEKRLFPESAVFMDRMLQTPKPETTAPKA